jgi:hypothetical protein
LIVWFLESLNVLFYVLLGFHIFFVQKKEKWAKLIGWCPPLSHKLSNVPVGTKRLGTTGVQGGVWPEVYLGTRMDYQLIY